MNIIVTTPPYADFLDEVAAHPLVSGLRLNTVMPLRDGPGEALDRLSGLGKPVWVDLKGRQLRVAAAAVPPYTEVALSHPIEVTTPVNAFFSDGHECAKVVAVDQHRLILADGPRRLIGPGESVNIVDPSLKICGTLTETDRAYLTAMRERGMQQVMLSFVESQADLDEVHTLLPDVELVAKIESQKGLAFAKTAPADRLMAARGDLYVEVDKPHQLIPALRSIIQADPNAIVASRLLNSMAYQPIPEAADLSDIAFLYEIGYRTFMLGDAVCLRRESVMEALNVMEELAKTL
ncbi:MAG: pyruvate kinase [Chloroflexota bacterium]